MWGTCTHSPLLGSRPRLEVAGTSRGRNHRKFLRRNYPAPLFGQFRWARRWQKSLRSGRVRAGLLKNKFLWVRLGIPGSSGINLFRKYLLSTNYVSGTIQSRQWRWNCEEYRLDFSWFLCSCGNKKHLSQWPNPVNLTSKINLKYTNATPFHCQSFSSSSHHPHSFIHSFIMSTNVYLVPTVYQ